MLIEQDGKPVHYKMLTDAIQSSGVMDLKARYAKPSDSIYGLLVSASRHGDRIKFMGNGIFVAKDSLSGVESLAVQPPPKPDSRPAKSLRVLNGTETCKDCRFFTTTQLQLLVGTIGSCGSSESGRCYVSFGEQPCKSFAVKSVREYELEHLDLLAGLALVEAVNTVQAKRPRRQDERA